MPHILTILAAVIAVLGLIVFSFKQEDVPENLLKPHATQVESELITSTSNIAFERTAQDVAPKSAKLSATALAYYKQAREQGYESLVSAFESGAIANSDMSEKEKQKMCSITISWVRVAELKRLEQAGCHTQIGTTGFSSVNGNLKMADGTVDQAAVIEKLEYLRERDQLKTERTYSIAELNYQEHDSLYNLAVGFDLDQVFDYLQTIDAPLPQTDLINNHLKGRHPNVNMIKKLEKLGYTSNAKSQDILRAERFQNQYKDVYQYLNLEGKI